MPLALDSSKYDISEDKNSKNLLYLDLLYEHNKEKLKENTSNKLDNNKDILDDLDE